MDIHQMLIMHIIEYICMWRRRTMIEALARNIQYSQHSHYHIILSCILMQSMAYDKADKADKTKNLALFVVFD